MSDVMEFEAAEPSTDPKLFALTATRVRDGEGNPTTERIREEFSGVPALSFGVLLDNLIASGGNDAETLFAYFDRALVDEDQERFRAFLTDPDVYVDRDVVIDIAQWLAGQHADRPTTPPSASRPTRRSGGRGSAAKRR